MRPTEIAGINMSTSSTDEDIVVVPAELSLITIEQLLSGDVPDRKPEVEPEKTPDENPGLVPETKPNRDNDEGADDDDEDDDDDDDPFTETEIGDDPDDIKTKTTIM